MVHDIKFIQEVLRDLDARTGNDTSDIPVEVDSWLDSFGIVAQYESYDYDEDFYPIGFKFSEAITKCDTEALVDTIIHEYAHYIHATVRKSPAAGKHDQEFQEIVISLGSTNYGQTCSEHIASQLAALKQLDEKELRLLLFMQLILAGACYFLQISEFFWNHFDVAEYDIV